MGQGLMGIGKGRRPWIDDVLARHENSSRGAWRKVGLHAAQLLRAHRTDIRDAIGMCLVDDGAEPVTLGFRPGDNQSPTPHQR